MAKDENKIKIADLKKQISLRKQNLALQQDEVNKALELFQVIRDIKNDYGELDDELINQLKGVTNILTQHEKDQKAVEALENKLRKAEIAEKNRGKAAADAEKNRAKAAATAQRQKAKEQRDAERSINKEIISNLHSSEEFDKIQRSISNTFGKQNDAYKIGQEYNKRQHTMIQSVAQIMQTIPDSQAKTRQEAEDMVGVMKDYYETVQRARSEFAKGIIGSKELADITEDAAKNVKEQLSTMKFAGKAGNDLKQIFEAQTDSIAKEGQAARKTSQHISQMESAMDALGKSGIPLANELSDAITSLGQGADAARIAFTALGAAIGAMAAKIIPGLAQMNASLKAGNDIIEEKIELTRKLAELQNEATFIPQKIGLEAQENLISGQMEINKLAREGQFNVSKIALERTQNEIETANSVNRAMIDAQYAASRAAVSFNQQLQSGAAQFLAAAKTARSGEALGDVKGDVALLQLAGISADDIANSLSDASEILGKSPLPEQAKQMSIFARRTGAAASDVAQLSSVMEVVDGASLDTSLNLQEGIRAMAAKTGQSFGRLMKSIAASSKKMLDYGILNTEQLAKQVAYAKSMGLEFDAIGDAGRNMVLNYQDSIKGEMQLSALLGRQIDLSEARQRFFEGDTSGAIEAMKAQGLTAEELRSPFVQEAFKNAAGGFDPNQFLNVISRTGAEAGPLQEKDMGKGNEEFLDTFKKALQKLNTQEAIISAKTAIIDARLSGKITEAYLKSPGYLEYQNNLNKLSQDQASLTTRIADDWLNSPENLAYQRNLNLLSQEQAKLDAAISKAFLSSKAYTDYLVEKERLGVRRDLTENLVPTIGAIGGGALFNFLGGRMFGGGGMGMFGGGGMNIGPAGPMQQGLGPLAPQSMQTAGKAPGGMMMMGTQTGAGFGSNLAGAFKSGGTITGGVITGLTSGFMEFSENKQLGISMGENIGRTTTKAISAGVGGWGGASLGAAIGTAIFPGVGTLVGGLLGGWLGGKGGDALGDAVNNGIWGDKQERIKRTQEEQLQAQNELQKQMSLNRQVDVGYYSKMLKLNDQQITQLQNYNKTAVSPEWLKNPPAWYLKSGGRDFTPETYAGSGIRSITGWQPGSKENPFGVIIDYVYDQATKEMKAIPRKASAKEYKAEAKKLGWAEGDMSEKQLLERANKAYQSKGKITYNENDPFVQDRIKAGLVKSASEAAAEFNRKALEATPEYKKRVEEQKAAIIEAFDVGIKKQEEFNKNYGIKTGTPDIPPYMRAGMEAQQNSFAGIGQYLNSQNKSSTYGKPFTEWQSNQPFSFNAFLPSYTPTTQPVASTSNLQGLDTKNTTLNIDKQATAVETGTRKVFQDYNEPGVLQVRDHNIKDLGIDKILNLIQSQAHQRGINLATEIRNAASTITDKIKSTTTDTWGAVKASDLVKGISEMRDNVVGAINRLLVFTKATSINKDAQDKINNLAGGGLGTLMFPGFAMGTKSAKGGLSMVGEEGPELMYVPQSAAIVPNDDTKKLKSGDTSILSKWGISGYADGKKPFYAPGATLPGPYAPTTSPYGFTPLNFGQTKKPAEAPKKKPVKKTYLEGWDPSKGTLGNENIPVPQQTSIGGKEWEAHMNKKMTFGEKVWAVASNPMTAAKMLINRGSNEAGEINYANLTTGIKSGQYERNIMDTATDILNPAYLLNTANQVLTDVGHGNYAAAGLNLLSIIPGGEGKVLSKLFGVGGKGAKYLKYTKNKKAVQGLQKSFNITGTKVNSRAKKQFANMMMRESRVTGFTSKASNVVEKYNPFGHHLYGHSTAGQVLHEGVHFGGHEARHYLAHKLAHHATGTTNAPGGLSMVGEKGPELMYVPQSAAIVPNKDTNRIKSGDVSLLSKWGITGYKDGKEGDPPEGEHHSPNVVGWFNTLASLGGLLPFLHLINHHSAETNSQKQREILNSFLSGREMLNLIYGGHHNPRFFGHLIEKVSDLRQIWDVGKHFLGTGAALKLTGKTFLKEWIAMGLAPEVLIAQGAFSALVAADQMEKQSQGLGGVEASSERNVRNYTTSLGASMYDLIDEWLLSGLGDKLLGKTTGLTLPGLNGTDTNTLRGLYWTSNPDKNQNYVTNNDLLAWLAANDVNSFSPDIQQIVTKAKKLAEDLGIKPDLYTVGEGIANTKYAKKLKETKDKLRKEAYGYDNIDWTDSKQVTQKLNEIQFDLTIQSREAQPGVRMSYPDSYIKRQDQRSAADAKYRKSVATEKEKLKVQTQAEKEDWNEAASMAYGLQMTPEYINVGGKTMKASELPGIAEYREQQIYAYNQSSKINQITAKPTTTTAKPTTTTAKPTTTTAKPTTTTAKPTTTTKPKYSAVKGTKEYQDTKTGIESWIKNNKFAKGVDSAPGGMAMVGEKGMEMMLHNGMASMIGVDGPEIRYVPKGAEILPNHKLPAMADGTMGATAAMMASNTQQLMQIGQIIADAIVSKQEQSPTQNINLLVDGRQLANVQYRRQQNRLGMRPNDLV